jgi:hypothetical protein
MADNSRTSAGFRTLARGMDGGKAASLIGADQVALAVNMTFRGAYMKTRPPYANHVFTFADDTTQANWTGKFQGWAYYDGEAGQSGWVIARGGRLFFLPSDTWILREITPSVLVTTISDFTVPAVGAMVDVHVNAVGGITVGNSVLIHGGAYNTGSPSSNPIPFLFLGGDAPGILVPSGTQLFFASGASVTAYQPFPANKDFIFMFQAENYMIILGGQHTTVIFNGTTARQASIGEIPVGEIGAYGWGRIWISRPGGHTYEGGNLVYGKTNSRADILGWDENDYLNEGGSFAVPYNAGPITSMQFLASQDTSLGQGPLIIGTQNMVFSNQAPVDRDVWKNLRYPIQTIALLEYGPEGGRCFTQIGGDIWYRSLDGIRSFIVARRSFGQPGNVPLSREMAEVLKFDDTAMLGFAGGLYFDNRFLCTLGPMRTDLGIIHKGLVVVNFDLLSNMGDKSPAAWEGIWTGIDILALSKARIAGVERAFAIVSGCEDIQFWELKKEGIDDQYSAEFEDVRTATTTEIVANFNPSFTDETVTYTVTVAPASGTGATPTGDVRFYVAGSLIATHTLVAGVCTFTHSFAGGNYAVQAIYEGSAIYASSSGSLTQAVFFTSVIAVPTTRLADGSAAVTITVEILNSNANPISGLPLTFVISSVGNLVSPVSLPNTNVSGISSLSWTTALSKTKTFTVTIGAPYNRQIPTVASVVWNAQNPMDVTSIILAFPTSVVANNVDTTTISVILLDAGFNPCLGRTATLSSSGTGNTITPTGLTMGTEVSLAILNEVGGLTMPIVGGDTASMLVSDSTQLIVGEVVNFRWNASSKNAFMRVISKADSTHAVFRTLGTFGGASWGPTQLIPQSSTITKAGIDDGLMRSSVAEAKVVTATIAAPLAGGPTITANVTFT